jgi:GT2 family glycosyltransferase
MPDIEVTISIVSYNSKAALRNCIVSIFHSTTDLDIQIIVVDNCSEDGSAKFVKEHFPALTVIENTENVGFGKAHNQAFRLAKGRYFLILNPDTIVFPGAIEKMVQFMSRNPLAGVVGCKIWWDDERKFIFPDLKIHSIKTALLHFTPFCRYFPNSSFPRNYWRSAYLLWSAKEPVKVEGITGGIMMIRSEVFESVGSFDENFFLFFEEHDLLRQVKAAGWKIYYLPNAEIQHFFEESCRNCHFDIGKIYKDSALYYYKKHYRYTGYYYIKTLMKLNNLILKIEQQIQALFPNSKNRCPAVYPENNEEILIEWAPEKGVNKYIVEIAYSPGFCDRGGMYVQGESLSLKSDILERLPNNTGFLRILPVYADLSTGKIIKKLKITNNPDTTV